MVTRTSCIKVDHLLALEKTVLAKGSLMFGMRSMAMLLIMAALWNRTGHYIFALWFLLLSSSFFPLLSQPSQIGCLPYFHTWCGLTANLRCRSEMYCMRLAENTGCKKLPSRHYRTILLGYIFATKVCIDNRKKTC